VRGIARSILRAALAVGRRGPLRRHLLRLRFGPWATRWLSGRVVVGWRGVRVEVDPGEAHGYHVFVHGDYGGAELDACIDLARDARLFLDVGAHIGLVALAGARACPQADVIAVEADPDVAVWLRRNLALNPDLEHRVTVLEAAASDHDGEVPFTTSASSSNVGVGHISTGDTPHSSRLRAVALGSWLASEGRSADVVKMDVEGAELGALAGLWEHGATPPCILLETHAHAFPDGDAFNTRLLHAFARHGYDVERLDRGTWTPVTAARQLGPRSHLRARRKSTGTPSDASL